MHNKKKIKDNKSKFYINLYAEGENIIQTNNLHF